MQQDLEAELVEKDRQIYRISVQYKEVEDLLQQTKEHQLRDEQLIDKLLGKVCFS